LISACIPGWYNLELRHLVLDLNGTIAVDGQVLPDVAERLTEISAELTVHLVTADTRGQAALNAWDCIYTRSLPGMKRARN
jgi:soluble P-type ATPase